MKSTDEIASRVFARRDEYEKEKKKKRKIAFAASLAVIVTGAAIALYAAYGVGYEESEPYAVQGSRQALRQSESPVSDGDTQSASDVTQTPDDPAAADVIVVNEVGGWQSWASFAGEETDRATVASSFAFNVIPTPPADLTREYYSALISSSEDHENYWFDSTFASETDGRWMMTIVSNRDPQQDEALRIKEGEASTVCGVPVTMIHYTTYYGVEPGDELTPLDNYVCVFEYRSEHFWMNSAGLTLDEFTDAIRSIVAG